MNFERFERFLSSKPMWALAGFALGGAAHNMMDKAQPVSVANSAVAVEARQSHRPSIALKSQYDEQLKR